MLVCKLARYNNAVHTFYSHFKLIVHPDNRRFLFKEAENLMSLIKTCSHIIVNTVTFLPRSLAAYYTI